MARDQGIRRTLGYKIKKIHRKQGTGDTGKRYLDGGVGFLMDEDAAS